MLPWRFLSLPVVKIDHTSFRIDGFLFQRESDEARSFIQRAVVGDVDPDILPHDFACFLRVADCRYASLSDYVSHVDMPRSIWEDLTVATKEEWTAVLALAHKLNFARIRALAIRSLRPITTAVDQLVLAHDFGVVEWTADARRTLCEQEDWPTREDCRRLGVDLLFQIGQARQALRPPGVLVPAARREAILASVFGEPDPGAAVNPSAAPVEPGVAKVTAVSQDEPNAPFATSVTSAPPRPAGSRTSVRTLRRPPLATDLQDTDGWFDARSTSAAASRARAERAPPGLALLPEWLPSASAPSAKAKPMPPARSRFRISSSDLFDDIDMSGELACDASKERVVDVADRIEDNKKKKALKKSKDQVRIHQRPELQPQAD
jgi:hypothetical protein